MSSDAAERSRELATKVLESPRFFTSVIEAFKCGGLVAEEQSALALYIVATSRLLARPLNAIVKGRSSSGKNWLVSRVLKLFPLNAVKEITSCSDQSWSYAADDFRHTVLYLQERNESVGAVHPIRLLISEGKLKHNVALRTRGGFSTTTFTARGPVASISTTTLNQIQLDDETRHISIWVDESPEQTKRILRDSATHRGKLAKSQLRVWRTVQQLLATRARNLSIAIPAWFAKVADAVYVDDIRVRRYWPAFIEACKVVCLLRSFSKGKNDQLEIDFSDLAVTSLIFGNVFTESIHRGNEQTMSVYQQVVTGQAI